jgi:anti-anti-sigma regulatory factor
VSELDKILEGFRTRFLAGTPFAHDRELAEDLAVESRPAIEAVLFAVRSDDAGGLLRDEHGESLAMITLLGRRAGVKGASPTAATNLVPAIAGGFEDAGVPLAPTVVTTLMSMCLEGYAAGRADVAERVLRDRMVGAQAVFEVVPKVHALVLSGEHDAETLIEVVEAFTKALHRSSAMAAIVDLSRIRDASAGAAAEIFSAHHAARAAGARAVFVGVTEPWRRAASVAHLSLDLVETADSFSAALDRVLPLAGYSLRRAGKSTTLWERVFGPKR